MAAVVAIPLAPVEHSIATTGPPQTSSKSGSDKAAPKATRMLLEAGPEQKHPEYNLPEISLVDRYADEPRKLRVAVIGAGLSGIIAGVLLPAKVPGIELTIFEKNADVVSDTTSKYSKQSPNNDKREALGLRIFIPESAVMFRHMYTRHRLRQIRSGPRSMPRAQKSESTGQG